MAGVYGSPTPEGRAHRTRHHFVAERFFGRSANRPGETRDAVFASCPWGMEGKADVFCFECHEVLLHNPVFLPEDIAAFAALVRDRGLAEDEKPADPHQLAGRVRLLHEVIRAGLGALRTCEPTPSPTAGSTSASAHEA
jgi:hypothetical protein